MVHELIALYKSLGVSDQPSPTSIKSNSAYQLVMTDSTDSGAGVGAGKYGEGKYGEEEKKEEEASAAGFVTRALAEAVAGGATTGGPGSSGGGGGDSVRGNAVVVEEEDETGRDNVVPFLDAFSNVEDATVSLMVGFMNGGSLQNLVDGGGCESEATIANIARQSLLGLRCLHMSNHLHRDIKPANMLINHTGDVKLSDFGIVRKLEAVDPRSVNGMMDPGLGAGGAGGAVVDHRTLASAHTFVGTVTYMSPERINGEAYSTPSDVWALGLSIMTCALGRIPIKSDAGYWSLLKCVRDDPPPTLPEGGPWSDDFRDLITRCLQKDPAKRATCDELLMHPFVANASRDSEGGGEDGEDGEDDPNVQQMLTEQAVGELMAMLDAVKAHLTRLQSAHRLASLTDLLLANQKERELAAASNGGSVATLQTMQSGTEGDLLKPDGLLHASMSDLLHRRSLRRLADQLNLPQKEVEARVEKYLADLSADSGGMRMSVAD
mmetsp:Transcript_37678/g.86985  ORF Transcript_37678/g.86985 Transcript_37678/m.86985 type:complete len:493 (+) Transcript_37678:3-1481(+)